MIIPPPDTAEQQQGMEAAAALAPPDAAETWTLTVESAYFQPKRLERLSPDAPLGAFLVHAKAELGLPAALPLTRLKLWIHWQ